jgi:hypothetical protein
MIKWIPKHFIESLMSIVNDHQEIQITFGLTFYERIKSGLGLTVSYTVSLLNCKGESAKISAYKQL